MSLEPLICILTLLLLCRFALHRCSCPRLEISAELRKDTYSWKCLATMAAQDAAAETTMSPLAHLTSQSAACFLFSLSVPRETDIAAIAVPPRAAVIQDCS